MNKWLKYLLRGLMGLIILVLVCWMVLYIYFIANKRSILKQVSSSLGESINGQILLDDVGLDFLSTFPYMSLNVKDFAIRDSMFATHHIEFLRIKHLLIRSNPMSLISGKIAVSKVVAESGKLFVFTDSTGYTNKYLLVSKKTKPPTPGKQYAPGLPFEELGMKDMDLNLQDDEKHKLFSFFVEKLNAKVENADSMLRVQVKINSLIKSLAFNISKGSFAEQKPFIGDFEIFINREYLKFEDIRVAIGNEPLSLSGNFHLLGDKIFQLRIGADKADFDNAKKLLTPVLRGKIAAYHLARPFNFFVDIKGKLARSSEPLLDIECSVEDNLVTTPVASFVSAGFKGKFTSEAKDSLSAAIDELTITDFKADWQGIPIVSKKLVFSNLKNPVLHGDVSADCDLSALNNVLGSETFLFNQGKLKAKVDYYGPLTDTSSMVPAIKGTAVISDGEILYGPRQVSLQSCNGTIVLNNQDVYIKDLRTKAQGNSIILNVEAKNIVALMQRDADKIALNCNIYSKQLDINTLKSLLSARKKTVSKKPAELTKIAREINDIMDQCTMRCDANVDKMIFKKFVATNVKANFQLTNDQYSLNNVSLKHAGGDMQLQGYSRGGKNNISDIQLKVKMNNVDVSQVFYAFDNFGMESLNSKSLKGKLDANIFLNTSLNSKTEMIPESSKGNVFLSLKNGELVDFKPLQDMSFFLLKKRDFSNIAFAELKDSLRINGQQITVNRMEIQSSVLSLFVEGLYDLKGPATNLQIQVPLNNLKKRKADYQPENKGVDAKQGLSVFVSAKGSENGNIGFSYSLSNKVAKKKKREMKAMQEAAAQDSTKTNQ